MSTSGSAGPSRNSLATRSVRWGFRKAVRLSKRRYEKGSTKGMLAVYLGVSALVAGILIGGAALILAPLSIPVRANGSIVFFSGLIAFGSGGWVGYRARKEVKQRRKARELHERGGPKAAGEAVGFLTSADPGAQSFAALTVAEAGENGSGAVVKNAPVTVDEVVARLVALLDGEGENVRGNAAASLRFLAQDYPDEVRKHTDRISEAVRRPETTVQQYATLTLGVLAGTPDAEPQEVQTYLDPVATAAQDEAHRVRRAACFPLAYINDDRAREILESLRNDTRPEVREEATDALSLHRERREARSERRDASGETASGEGGNSDDDMVRSPPEMDFDDIAGMADLKETLRERVIAPFTGADAYAELEVGSDSGILFHGPPGTGKTHTAKCLAGELGINYLPVRVGDIESKYTGEGVQNITEIFDQAHRNQPCLVFLDEIDAIAGDRSDGTQQSNEQKQVNQMLQEMSDLGTGDDLLVIAASNDPDSIDDAMLRTGRFDSKVEVPMPDAEARLAIFKHHLSAPIEDSTTADVDVEGELQNRTMGCSGSDMERIANAAARLTAKRRSKLGTNSDQSRNQNQTTTIQWEAIEQAIEEVAREQEGVGRYTQQPPTIDFDDVAGMTDLKAELRERIIDPLESPEMFAEYGVSVDRGFVLHGPPGTGKTHMARCLAGELGVTYIQAKTGDLVSKWIGEGAQNVQQMFNEARQSQPCLIFLDEIDALATSRGHQQTKSERQMVNQFLDEIGGIQDGEDDVIVVGATNRLGDVDDAIVRTGRLEEKIEVPPPDVEARGQIFEHHLNAPREGLDIERIAALTEGFVASDMERLAETAARGALKQTRRSGEPTPVSQTDVEDAIEHIRSRK